jgi:hypothetical protein
MENALDPYFHPAPDEYAKSTAARRSGRGTANATRMDRMSDTKTEIAGVFRTAADALRRGADATELGALLYLPELVVVGEGWPRAIRGFAAFKPDLAALLESWGPNPDLTFSILDPVIGGGDSATTLVDVFVAPKKAADPGERYRVIYAWIRTERGWRVAVEMYMVGSF